MPSRPLSQLPNLKSFYLTWQDSSTALSWHSIAAQGCNIACLGKTRGVLRLEGKDVIHFLQGLITNDARLLEPVAAKPIYACLNNAQGRYLHDMFLYRTEGDAVLVDCDRQGLPDLLRLLKRYRLRSQVDVEDISSSFAVWAAFGRGCNPQGGWYPDPRLRGLGYRAILPPFPEPDLTSCQGAQCVSHQEFQRWRMTLGVGEGDSEIPSGEAIALEYNLDALNGVSFDKGCYVGQELMARTHFRGAIRKRLMPVEIQGEAAVGDEVTSSVSGKVVGRITAVAGKQGLGLLRLRNAEGAMQMTEQLLAGSSIIMPSRPTWWPSSWGQEDHMAAAS